MPDKPTFTAKEEVLCNNCGKVLIDKEGVYVCRQTKKVYCYTCSHDPEKYFCGYKFEPQHEHLAVELKKE